MQTVRAIHAASLDNTLWPAAIAATAGLCGGVGGTLEIYDKAARRHSAFYSIGVPALEEKSYVEYWAARSPRVSHGLRQKAGDIGYDHQILDEAAIDRDEFYSGLLRPLDFRYFVSTALANDRERFSVLAVQRTPRQGHVGAAEIDIIRRLTPHIQVALDIAERLGNAARRAETFEQSFEWLEDGVAQIAGDGRVAYCNAAFARIAAEGDGIRIDRGAIAFNAPGTQAQFRHALAAMGRAGANESDAAAFADFRVARLSETPAYIVSLRPLPHGGRLREDARIAVFVKDPTARHEAARDFLRELFGLTPAEAALACAMQQGISPVAYARKHALSRNTVYSHLRKLKDKTGWPRADTLIRKLGELELPARAPTDSCGRHIDHDPAKK